MYVICQCQKCAVVARKLQVIKTETSEFNLGIFVMTLHYIVCKITWDERG
jgi:hypothetical protein